MNTVLYFSLTQIDMSTIIQGFFIKLFALALEKSKTTGREQNVFFGNQANKKVSSED